MWGRWGTRQNFLLAFIDVLWKTKKIRLKIIKKFAGDITTEVSHKEHRMKKRIFVLREFVKRVEKIIFSLIFVCFRFPKISYFLSFPSNENVRKQHLFVNAYFRVNMKFSYTIAERKDEIFCRIVTKTSDFLLVFRSTFRWQYLSKKINISVVLQRKQAIGQLFIEYVYIFPIISFRKGDYRIAYLFFVSTLR